MFKSKTASYTDYLTAKDVAKSLTPIFVGLGVKLLLIAAFKHACRNAVREMAKNDPELQAKLERLEAH